MSIQININCFHSLSAEFNLEVQVSDACRSCHGTGQCHQDEKEKFYCANTEKGIDSTDNRRSGKFELVLKVLSINLKISKDANLAV